MTEIKPDPDVADEQETQEHLNNHRPRMASLPFNPRVASATPGHEDIHMSSDSPNSPSDQNLSTPATDVDPEQTHDSHTNDAMHKIGADSRELIKFIQRLEALSIKNTLPSLPKFVVVGDQSAGKSSIIEAVCDIQLPRGEGTCTRCPFKITTTSSKGGSWTCKISVHRKYRYDANARARKQTPYKHWIEEEEVAISDIAVIHQKEDVELALRRAQVAILNPDQSPCDFIDIDMSAYLESEDMEMDNLISVAFSPNWVALDISSPNLPELSLFDLPGAINAHSDDDKQYLIKFIEELMKSYMKEEKTLVLLACPMNADIDNTTALRYMRECNTLARSMGVRTKPDTVKLDRRRLKQEISLLQNEKFKLGGGGWFISKQCSQDEIEQGNITYADARRMEDEFFAQEIWTEVLHDFQDRLGTRNLQAALSEKLTTHIREDVPAIFERIQTRCSQVEKELSKFPAPEETATVTVMKEIAQLRVKVAACMSGDAIGSEMFSNKFRKLFKALTESFQECAPELIVTTPGWTAKVVEIDENEDEDEAVDPSPSKKVKVSAGRAVSMRPGHRPRPQRQRRGTSKSEDEETQPQSFIRFTFYLDQLKDKLDSAPGADIPDQIDQRVVRSLMVQSLCGWPAAMDRMFKDMKALFAEALRGALSSIDGRRGTAFHDAIVKCVSAFLEDEMEEHEARINGSLACELHLPFTVSKNYPPEAAAMKLEHFKRRNIQRVKEYFDDPPEGVKRLPVTEHPKKAADAQWLEANLGDDEYEREIAVFVRIAAYYNTTYSQFVDQVSKSTRYHVLGTFESRLFNRIIGGLPVSDPVQCEVLLARNQHEQRQYQALIVEHKKLTAALEELQRLC